MINYDDRWYGNYGIARYSQETKKYFPKDLFRYVSGKNEPMSMKGMLEWQLNLSPAIIRGEYIYSPSFTPIAGYGNRQIITIHDLIHLDVPEESSKSKLLYYNYVIKPVILNSPIIFTVSEYSKQKISDWSGAPLERIYVTGNSVSEKFNQYGEKAEFNFDYLVYVGNQKPHKNTEIIIKLLKELPSCLHLVMVGKESSSNEELIQKMGLRNRVHNYKNLSDEKLAKIYRGATATVMPSRYEGFGIPVLESMACGTPVISSNSTSLPEVGGDAALYFDPDDVDTLKNHVLSVYFQEKVRDGLSKAGVTRMRDNSWEKISLSISSVLQYIV